MKRRLVKWGTILCAALAMLILAGNMLLKTAMLRLIGGQVVAGDAASIGIIGGADGPTAIFVATKAGPVSPWLLAGILAALSVAGLLWLRHIDRR